MKNYAQELFLLITTLSQLRNKDRIIQLFIESLNNLFQDYSFTLFPEKPVEYDSIVEVCTRNKNYGYISYVTSGNPDDAIFDLIRNTSQLLALLLEKLEQDELLLDQKNHLQILVEERTNELQKINLQLEIELTGHRQAEEALLNATQRLSKVGGWEFNVETGKSYWTEELYRIHELPVDSGIDHFQESLKCYRPEDRLVISDAFQLVIEKGETYDLEFPFTTFSGQPLWIRTTAHPVYENGKVVRVIGNVMDITGRKQVEKTLEDSEKRYRELFDNANIAIFQSTPDGKVIMVNPEFARMFGYESPKEVATTVKNVGADLFADPQRRAEIMRLKAEHPHLNEFENLYRRKDGSTFLGKLHLHSVTDLDGQMFYFEGFIEDITEPKRAEEALLISEGRYRIGQAMGHVGNWEYNLQTTAFWGSDEAKRIYGFDLELPNFTTDEVENCIPERERVHQALVDLIEADKPYNLEFEIHPKNSLKPRIISSFAELKRDDHGNPLLVTGVIQDITRRKEAEEALRAASLYERSLIEASLDPLVTISADGKITDVNKATESVTGITREQLIFSDFSNYFTEPEKARAGYQLVLAQGLVKDYPLTIRHTSGKTTDVLYNATIYRDESGKLKGVFAAAHDITARKEAEDALHNSENDLKEAQRLGRLGSWNWDITTDTISWSEEYYHIYGLDPTQRPPGYEEHLKAYTPESATRLDAAVKRNVQTGEPYEVDLELSGNMGPCRWITARSETKYDDKGQIVGLRGTAQDITGRKQAEQEIKKLNQKLEKRVAERTAQLEVTNKELEAFAYSVSHDLRAPLRSIDGFSQVLVEVYHDKLDAQGKDYLHRVRSASQRMGQLIDDLLNLSRVTRSEINIQQVNLSEMFKEIADEFLKIQSERQVEFIIQKGIKAKGDSRLLQIILENLIGNAWKFTSNHPTAQIEFGVQDLNNTPVYFIRDDGAGFNMKYAQKLFGAFQRLHKETEFPGTGIGLATVQRVIHRHGGKVWAEGEVEKGATFYFTLA